MASIILTTGESSKYKTLIAGENINTTNSLFLMAKVFGVSSAKIIVMKLKGKTTIMTESASAVLFDSENHSLSSGDICSSAPAPPTAAATAPAKVITICTTAKPPSICSFIKRADFAPFLLAAAKTESFVLETDANAIS